MSQDTIEALMDRWQRRGILARRPYPPVDLPPVHSRLGGLPDLPDKDAWPRASDGTPLHFLVRIDCSELPSAGRGPLPDKGVLQFFARIDEEMIWNDDPALNWRVLYFDTRTGTPTLPPDDLPAIEGGWHKFDREMRLPAEPERRIYPHWPLVFESIRTWPVHLPDETGLEVHWRDYATAVERAQAAEIVRTTGWSIKAPLEPEWGRVSWREDGQRVVELPDRPFSGAAFPQAWIIIERISRAMVCGVSERKKRLKSSSADDAGFDRLVADLEGLSERALHWIGRATLAGLDGPTTEEASGEFAAWLSSPASDSRSEIRYVVAESVRRGMSAAIKYCGGSPAAAAAVPVRYMNCLEDEHSLTKVDTYGIGVAPPRRWIRTRHHQLLGHASASQSIDGLSGKDVLLLHLISDRGVDFMFCDCGEIQFWIDADDLRAKRFDRVKAYTQGG